ncbi:MAG: glycosyltransferase, partial [Oscillospiraceae bacterium]
MNILQFADYSAPYEGNFIKSLRHLEEMLKPHRVVYLFTLNTKHQEWVKSFDNVYFLTESTMKNIAIIMKIIKKEKINLIHTHFSIMKYDLPLKIARIFSRKTLYVRHMHMIYINKKNWLLEKFKKSVANADVEIACGSATFDAMLSAGIDKTRLYLVENGIDFSRLDKFETINSAGYNILMFGYNYHIKGVDIAIKAIEKLPNTTLNIVLAANASDVKQNIMHDFGKIPENVNFLSPREDIATYYH